MLFVGKAELALKWVVSPSQWLIEVKLAKGTSLFTFIKIESSISQKSL